MELSVCGLGGFGCCLDNWRGIDYVRRVLDKLEVLVGSFSVLVQWQCVDDSFI